MSSECSLLCSLQLWTLKYAGLHERNIDVHSYQEKPKGTERSLLSLVHRSSSATATKNATTTQAVYQHEFNEYFTSRSLPFHLPTRIFHNLRDKLAELDQLLSSLKLIRTLWLSIDLIFMAFANGTVVFIHIDAIHRTLKKIIIDKTSLTKKYHITSTLADMYLNSTGFYIIYEIQSKIDLFHFNTPVRSFDSKFNFTKQSTRLISEELPPYSNHIPVRRCFHIDSNHQILTVWWSRLSEGISTSVHTLDSGQHRPHFNCLSIDLTLNDDKDPMKRYFIQTETSNPFFCSSTTSGLTTVEMSEHKNEVI
jgi:hypothetical protein